MKQYKEGNGSIDAWVTYILFCYVVAGLIIALPLSPTKEAILVGVWLGIFVVLPLGFSFLFDLENERSGQEWKGLVGFATLIFYAMYCIWRFEVPISFK